jgi:hypothetical protein
MFQTTDETKYRASLFPSPHTAGIIVGWTLFALAVILLYAFLWKGAPFRGTDTTDYLNAAEAIAKGDLATRQPRTPGFPLYLILVGTGRRFFIISLALHLIAVGLLAWVLRSVGARRHLVWLFVLVSVLPPFVQKDAYLLTEGLFEFLMVAGVALLWLQRRSWAHPLLSGLALALATITRPQNQLFPLVICPLMFRFFGWKQGMKFASLLIAPSILLVGDLMAYNYARYHDPNLTYLLGFHLGTRTVTLFDDIRDPQVRQIMVATRNAAYGDPNRVVYWTTNYTRSELMRVTDKSPAELARFMLGIHLSLIRHHPLAYLEEVGRANVHFWFPDLSRQTNTRPAVAFVSMLTQMLLSIMFWLAFLVWAGLSLAGVFMRIPDWLPDPILRWGYTASMAAIFYTSVICTAIDMGEARYRSTVDLLILFIIIVTVEFLWRQRSQKDELTGHCPSR